MYHARFKGTHYEAGYKYGSILNKNGVVLNTCPTFPITKERIAFGKKCLEVYEEYYPELVEEIKGMAEGNKCEFEFLSTLIFTMYCYNVDNRCSCFAFKDGKDIIFGRNSDFLVSIEKTNMNVLYSLDNSYKFNGNTTAFVEIEDGINEYGVSIGLTFIPIKHVKPGFNVGVLTRYLLEKCKSVDEVINEIIKLPIASGGTLTICDKLGNMKVIELHSKEINVINEKNNYICATNVYISDKMKKYNLETFDNWRAEERYSTLNSFLLSGNNSLKNAMELLSGKHGFICQYDRKQNADTVWSVIYDIANRKIYRSEGNPSRKDYKLDERMKFHE